MVFAEKSLQALMFRLQKLHSEKVKCWYGSQCVVSPTAALMRIRWSCTEFELFWPQSAEPHFSWEYSPGLSEYYLIQMPVWPEYIETEALQLSTARSTAQIDKQSLDTRLLEDIEKHSCKTQEALAAFIMDSEKLQFLSPENNNWGLVLLLCYSEAFLISLSDRKELVLWKM